MRQDQLTSPPLSREEFFDSYWLAIADQGWQAVVLHSWKELPEKIVSDIDYAVTGVAPRELLGVLSKFCNERGWRLAQVIEHEPGAFFCSCVQYGGDFEILALDVTWDYRRLGHLLIPSSLLQTQSRPIAGKSFLVPSPGAEAAYILAKAAAKGKDFDDIRPRLLELEAEDPNDFVEKLRQAFPDYQVPAERDTDRVASIKEWFKSAPSFRAVRGGHHYGIREIGLYLKRILQPTGIWLSCRKDQMNGEFMEDVVRPLFPLFRRVHRCDRISLLRLPQTLAMIIRTSLILERNARKKSGESNWRISVTAKGASDAAGITCGILDTMAARVARRFFDHGS